MTAKTIESTPGVRSEREPTATGDEKGAGALVASSVTARNLARKLVGDGATLPHLIAGQGRNAPQILDLAALRKAMGASWPSYGELIHRIAERMLHRHLGGAYEYNRVDDRYVVLFRGLSDADARKRIERIANSLAEFLFGTGSDDPDPMLGRRRYANHRRGLVRGRWRAAAARVAGRFGRKLGRRCAAVFGAIRGLLPSRGWSAAMANPNHEAGSHGHAARPPRSSGATGDASVAAPSNPSAVHRMATRGAVAPTAPLKDDTSPGLRSRNLKTQRRGTLRKDLPDSEVPDHIKAASARAAGHTITSEPPIVLAGSLPTGSGTSANKASRPSAPDEPPAVLAGNLPSKPVQPAMAAAQAILDAREMAGMEAAMTTAVARTATAAPSEAPPAPGQPAMPKPSPDAAAAPTAPAAKPATAAASPPVSKPAAQHRTSIDDLQFLYRPMWSVRTNMLAISTCLPAVQAPSGELLVGEAVLPPAAPLEFIERLDRAVLENAIDDCLTLIESGRSTLISVPVHGETLTDRDRRTAYLQICRTLPTAARRRLIFECLNIDRDTDHGQFVTALMNIKPYATLLIGQLSLRSTNFAVWKRAGLGSVGIDMTAIAGDGLIGEGQESKLIGELQHFAFHAAQHGLRPYVRGLGTLSLAAAAVSAGFDFIEGGVIQAQAKPMDVQSFTLEDLYLQYAVARRAKVSPARILNGQAKAASETAPEAAAPMPQATFGR